jgi:cytochrome c biogenesis protein ResB
MGRTTIYRTAYTLGAIIFLVWMLSGCSIPRTGVVLNQATGTYYNIECEAYERTPVEKSILICEVKP